MIVQSQTDQRQPRRCLLGRHRGLPAGMYSTLAGFVEQGESLEEAVAREVQEEVGLEVIDVTYKASQPWPFPASLMIAFVATVGDTRINLNATELEDARWFTAEQLRALQQRPIDAGGIQMSRSDSISRDLIEAWMLSEMA